jgi:tetratricopeptide (TPR) repeat protein
MPATLTTTPDVGGSPVHARQAPLLNRCFQYLLRPTVLIRTTLYLTLAVYLPSVLFGYVYDDVHLIVLNPWMASPNGIRMSFTRSFWAFLDYPRLADFYRPAVMTFLWVIRHTAGASPAWFHLAALAVHLAAVYLTYRLAFQLTGNGRTAGIAAVIFGLHPTKIESVAWISGVSDSLCLVFMLGCIITYLRWKDSGAQGYVPWSSFLLSLAAILSKEMAVAIPVLIALYELLTTEGLLSRRLEFALRVTTPYMAITTAVLVVRVYAMRALSTTTEHREFHFAYSVFSAPEALIWYLRKQLWPVPVSIHYPMLVVKYPSFLHFVVPLAGLLIASAILCIRLRKSAAGWFLAAWFTFTLAPVLAYGAVLQLHDRHMYAPSVATSIGLGYVIVWFLDRRTRFGIQVFGATFALIAVLCTAGTLYEERYWQDDVSLFSRDIVIAYDHSDAYSALAEAYFSRNDLDNAERVGRLWIQNTTNAVPGWCTIANARFSRGDYAGARQAFQQALSLAGTASWKVSPEAGLAITAEKENNYSDAVYWYSLVVAEEPSVGIFHDSYGHALIHLGRTQEGEREIEVGHLLRAQKGL